MIRDHALAPVVRRLRSSTAISEVSAVYIILPVVIFAFVFLVLALFTIMLAAGVIGTGDKTHTH